MKPLTKEQFIALIKLYKQARAKIALSMLNYDGVRVREIALLKTVDEQIKILEEATKNFIEPYVTREYKAEIKTAEKQLTELWVKGIWVANLTQIDTRAIEYIVSDMNERLIMSVRQVKRSVISQIAAVKQAKIRELLAVSQIEGKWVRETAKEASIIMKREWITGFINKRGARLKLDTYMQQLVRNNINEVHNQAAYNRYTEAWIEIVKYSVIADSKVSEICKPREGKLYYIKGIVPPPLWSHFNCRHTLIPQVKVPENVKISLHYPN
jgi:SPP1 gp7 family putative phage head morphogenesis protein